MHDLSDPTWLRRFAPHFVRLGRPRAVALLTLLVWVAAVGLAQLVVGLTGQGSRLVTTAAVSVCALTLTPLLGWTILGLVFRLEAARAELAVLAAQDGLTGAYNRRHFILLAELEWARSRRYDTEGALLLIDVDHFKRVNDAHGHLCGDKLLREITAATAASLRQPDVLARFGGEELIVLLPHTDPLGALDVAERIRERVNALRVEWQGFAVGTTVSIGVSVLSPAHGSLEAVIQEADSALYAAKDAGRNCVRAAPIQPRRSGEAKPVISK